MKQEVVVVSVEDILKTAMPATGTSHQLTAIKYLRLSGEWMVRKGAGDSWQAAALALSAKFA